MLTTARPPPLKQQQQYAHILNAYIHIDTSRYIKRDFCGLQSYWLQSCIIIVFSRRHNADLDIGGIGLNRMCEFHSDSERSQCGCMHSPHIFAAWSDQPTFCFCTWEDFNSLVHYGSYVHSSLCTVITSSMGHEQLTNVLSLCKCRMTVSRWWRSVGLGFKFVHCLGWVWRSDPRPTL